MTPDQLELDAAYRHCRDLARRAKSNFTYAFTALESERRRAMHALYAFMRTADDLVDDDSADLVDSADEKRSRLDRFAVDFETSLAGRPTEPLFLATVDTIRRFGIDPGYFRDAIRGVQMDLDVDRYADYRSLQVYCDRVASTVGLACMRIWGADDASHVASSIDLGRAMQLTNILRDVAEDAARGRLYLPLDELARFGVDPNSLLGASDSKHDSGVETNVDRRSFEALAAFQIERARSLYRTGAEAETHLPRSTRPVLRAMIEVYGGLLDAIAVEPTAVLDRRISASRFNKWRSALKAVASARFFATIERFR
jgi:phytoene synthase